MKTYNDFIFWHKNCFSFVGVLLIIIHFGVGKEPIAFRQIL